ncbi:MAG: T9SS type A sorting domain-containing protein [Nonlabens sp.]
MKYYYNYLIILFFSTLAVAQNNDFNNQGGDLLWSNPANWSLNTVPNTSNTGQVRLPLLVESLVDTDITISKIQSIFSTQGDVAVAGASTLTIDVGANAVQGIENVSNQSISLMFKGNLTINNSTSAGISNTLMRNQNGSGNSIQFADNSVLNLLTPLEARSGSSGNFSFNGSLAGTAPLRVNANTICTFGSTSNNSGYGGDLVWVGANASVVVNTADNNIFLPTDQKIQINAVNGSIDVNGINVFDGNISINGDRSFDFNLNENQDNLGTITFAGGSADGTLNFNLGSGVTNATFGDSSAEPWNNGTLNIINYAEGVLRFGTDNSALTAAQLSQITTDSGGGPVGLDSNGFLVDRSSLSIGDEFEINKTSVYPTFTTDKLFFSKAQNSVKIFDLNGRLMKESKELNQQDIDVSFLPAGLYMIILDGGKTEKFYKK